MKKIAFISILSSLSFTIGVILMVGGNHLGDYMVVLGAPIGLYSMYLIDVEEAKKPEKPENTL
jgi:hypothetical protein